jgi:hypothetical protein
MKTESILPTLYSLNSIFLVVEQLLTQLHTDAIPKHSFDYATEASRITLTGPDGQLIAHITSDDIDGLDQVDRELLKVLENSMNDRFKIWGMVYPQRKMSADAGMNAKTELQLEQILGEMCGDLDRALRYLEKINKKASEAYQRHIAFVCEKFRTS